MHRWRRRSWTAAASAAAALMGLSPLARPAAAQQPFELRELRVDGRPLLAFRLRAGGAAPGFDLGVVVARGSPPDEAREIALFQTRGGQALPLPRRIQIPQEAVAFDVLEVDAARGDELVLVSPRALEIVPVTGEARGRTIALEPPLPLPPRTRGLSLLGADADWSGTGEPAMLLPTIDGARVVALRSGAATPLSLPVQADYESFDPTTSARDALFFAQFTWPAYALGRDDSDPRRDLFALTRYGIHVFRSGASGLPPQPSRSMTLRPFTAEEELRPRATQLQILARDLDGDGLTDLLLHRTFGTLQRSEDRLEIHRNEASGADVSARPEALLAPEAGVAILDAVDLDGDGRLELVQARFGFGVVQILRALTTRRVKVELRVDRLQGPGIAGLARSWSGTISVALDFEQGRLAGIPPTVDGDWNGDRRRDLLLGLSGREIGILLGETGKTGPGFASSLFRQQTPATGHALVADLDGDGLDDLVVYDPRDGRGSVRWLHNQGALPGTPPELRASPGRQGD